MCRARNRPLPASSTSFARSCSMSPVRRFALSSCLLRTSCRMCTAHRQASMPAWGNVLDVAFQHHCHLFSAPDCSQAAIDLQADLLSLQRFHVIVAALLAGCESLRHAALSLADLPVQPGHGAQGRQLLSITGDGCLLKTSMQRSENSARCHMADCFSLSMLFSLEEGLRAVPGGPL